MAVGFERGPALDSFGNPATTAVSFMSSDGLAWRRAPAQAELRRLEDDRRGRSTEGRVDRGRRQGRAVRLHWGSRHGRRTDGLTWERIRLDAGRRRLRRHRLWGPIRRVGARLPGRVWLGGAGGHLDVDRTAPTGRARRTSRRSTQHSSATWSGCRTPCWPSEAGYRDDEIPVGTTWRSKDAATWPPRALPDGADHASFRLAVGDHALVTVGAQGSGDDVRWDTWTSAEGATWSRLPDARLAAGVVPRFPRPVLAFDGTSVLFMGQSGSTPTEASVFRLWLD